MPGPPWGIRVVELAPEIQGPCAGLTRSEPGVDVVKVESRVGGGGSRGVALTKMVETPPPEIAAFAYHLDIFNRGKRSVALDLKPADGRALLLLDGADVLLSKFGNGVLERLGYAAPDIAMPRAAGAIGGGGE